MKLTMMSAIPASILSARSGMSPVVGVRYIKATDKHPPIRLYYPAASTGEQSSNVRPAGWFQDTGIVPFLAGYLHTVMIKRDTWKFRFLALPLIRVVSWLLPLRWQKIPGLFENSACANDKKLPLIVFSHGLTGTGQENSVLAAAWAQRGYVVASLHHTDGSACCVRLADGTDKYYEHPPPFTHYDPKFRPNQVKHRAREMVEAYHFVTSGNCPADIQQVVDPNRAVAAGFSFGAATAALAAVKEKSFKAALFLDGWFHIDVTKSAGVEFNFPEEAFDKGISVPSLFINSEQFAGYSKLFAATKTLASNNQNKDNVLVLPGTGHQNFCDVIFWFRPSILRRMMRGAVGEAEPNDSFKEIVERSTGFFRKAIGKTAETRNSVETSNIHSTTPKAPNAS